MMKWKDKPVYICCGNTDMRKSINGLMTTVKEGFSLGPFAGALYVFCNRKRDRLKILECEVGRFWLYFKRLERGHFHWPSKGKDDTIILESEELSFLIEGAKLEKKLKRTKVFERQVS